MGSSCRSWRLAGGAFAVLFLLVGVVQGGPPAASDELKLTRPRQAAKAAGSTATAPDGDVPAGELLDQVERQIHLREGFLRNEVLGALRQARALAATDAAQAEDRLTLLRDKVGRAGDLRPEVRAQLLEKVEDQWLSVHRQALAQAERLAQTRQIAAESEARERINRQLATQEQKVDQLMARHGALMNAQQYRDAEAVAKVAEGFRPSRPGLRGAELTARMTGYVANTAAVRDMRSKGFVDAAQQVELSHVPTPDDSPIVYPDPETWQLLTERRKKYKAVDLTRHSASEEKILEALGEKTELDFVDQPLDEVIDFLKQRHGVEIQIDQRGLADAGIGSDTPITRSIKGITLRSALKLLLGELDLTYSIRNEVLLITSKSEAASMLTTRVYPVADLVVPIAAQRGGATGSGGGMFGSSGGMGGGMPGMGMGMGMGMPGMGMGMGPGF